MHIRHSKYCNINLLLSMKFSKVSPDHHVPFSSAMKKAQYLRGKTNIIDNGVFTALIKKKYD